MNIWLNQHWKKHIDINSPNYRIGLRLRFQNDIDVEVRRSCLEFCKWLRKQYFFPIRVVIYFKASKYIISQSREKASAIFFEPFDINNEPYIRIATGDAQEIEKNYGKDNALAAVLGSIIHELTHYFQWINNIQLTDIGYEKQAYYYRKKIIREYAKTREHP